MIDPRQPAGPVTVVASNLGAGPNGIAFDGSRIWTSNSGNPASVSIITPTTTTPWTVTNLATGVSSPNGILFDGSNIWVTDGGGTNRLLKLDQNGAIVQTVNVGSNPQFPAFDGTNIWVPNSFDNTVSVVRAATGAVLATLSGNGLSGPIQAAFDGQRILVSNEGAGSVSLWKAADLTPIGNFSVGGGSVEPFGACSDGTNFWITLFGTSNLARF
jgi:YVTN family beta-propeller protein